MIIIATIFFAGTIVMFLLANLPTLPIYENALLASLLLIIMTFPILYFVMLRPLRLHFNEFKRVEKALREKENFLQTIIETAPECIKIVSSDGTLLTMNRAGLDMIEADTLEKVKGKSVYSLINSEDRQPFRRLTEEVFQGKAGTLEFEIVGNKGGHLILETHAVPLLNDKGQVVSLLGITRNITERKRAERALLENEEKYRSLVESTDDSIYLVDKNYRYLYINKKHITRMGLSGREYVGQAYGEFHTPEETAAFIADVDKVFETGESMQREHRSGRDNRYFLLTLSPVRDDVGRTSAVTVISKDISELKGMEEKLRTLSVTDELTGLYNRRGFFTLGEQLLRLSRRQKKGVFMLYADMDNLKRINDTFGHQEGDVALITVANILNTTYRESDIVARIGGDEFIVISVWSVEDSIDRITVRLQSNIGDYNARSTRGYKLSVSFGTAFYDPESPCSIDELLKQAEKLMYAQKMLKR
jgi:diguanylate cyclase (GGDEF)-like protein/PAS domain S-box-containing protein